MKIVPKIAKQLRGIGLSEKEALVYAAVLELDAAFPSKVAEVTKLNRTTVYHILTDLAVKGLVTEIEKRKKLCYHAEPPKRLLAYTKMQKRLAEERIERAKKLLPDIEGLLRLTPNKPRIRYLEGVDGILAVYEDHISQSKSYEMLGISNVEALIPSLPDQFVRRYVRTKQKLGITTRAIVPKNQFSKTYGKRVYTGIQKKFLPSIKTIPAHQFPYHCEFTIYGVDKVSIVNFQKNVLIGVIIEEQTIADMMRMIFELAWAGTNDAIK
jgi:HTH-type transcriptional regulator, sugar sensing transcriptional regulator